MATLGDFWRSVVLRVPKPQRNLRKRTRTEDAAQQRTQTEDVAKTRGPNSGSQAGIYKMFGDDARCGFVGRVFGPPSYFLLVRGRGGIWTFPLWRYGRDHSRSACSQSDLRRAGV